MSFSLERDRRYVPPLPGALALSAPFGGLSLNCVLQLLPQCNLALARSSGNSAGLAPLRARIRLITAALHRPYRRALGSLVVPASASWVSCSVSGAAVPPPFRPTPPSSLLFSN